MARYVVSGFVIVFGVAALKTVLMVNFVLGAEKADFLTVIGLFSLFFALTSGVAYLGVTLLRSFDKGKREKRLAPGQGSPVAKESVITRYAPDWGLSQAEADVAIFVAKGFSNSEVAEMRGCAIATVKSQLSSIYQKSGLGSRYQLISFVTDEVCDMATVKDAKASSQIETRKILPLAGRRKQADFSA